MQPATTAALGTLFAALLLTAGCAAETGPVEPTEERTVQLDEHRSLGKPVETANLTVWPVFTDARRLGGESW